MIQPKTIMIEDKEFVISKVPALDAFTLFADLSIFLNGELVTKEDAIELRKKRMQEALSYCGVMINGQPVPFTTKGLVDNHVESFDYITKLLIEFMDYNTGFLKK